MKKLLFTLLILNSFYSNAQNIKSEILKNIKQIKSVDVNNTDFSDLESFGNAVGNAEIVFLGEQGHGDATTFEAKTRIIRYLHEQKGFNVLAFESDFFNIIHKSDAKKSVDEIEKSIFPIWSNCVQVNPLFDYIKNQQTKNPITITGFDCQIAQQSNSDDDRYMYLNTMKSYIENNIDVSNIEGYNLFHETIKDIIFFVKATKSKNAHFKKVKKQRQKKFFNTLSIILNRIEDKQSFLFQSLKNIKSYAKMAWDYKDYKQSRDDRMGENIIWLKNNKFSKEKIIVWAHSIHLVNKILNKKGKRVLKNISAGEFVYSKLGSNKIYSLGFSSRIGESQRATFNTKAKKIKIIKPLKNSFENWVFSKKYDFAFINFKSISNKAEAFYMKGMTHFSYKNNWLTAFDGIFYIDKMLPCIREK